MIPSLDILQAQVLGLPKAERVRLLDRLMASTESDTATEEAWEQIAAERDAEVESGAVDTLPLEDVIEQLRSKHAG
ncbi:MAG: addiction module protein [Xanthomonadales bacterium]|nr:addiction module protein [Xanthomonadales bacterium]